MARIKHWTQSTHSVLHIYAANVIWYCTMHTMPHAKIHISTRAHPHSSIIYYCNIYYMWCDMTRHRRSVSTTEWLHNMNGHYVCVYNCVRCVYAIVPCSLLVCGNRGRILERQWHLFFIRIHFHICICHVFALAVMGNTHGARGALEAGKQISLYLNWYTFFFFWFGHL